ncbi:MAG: hypothetical protein ACYTFY_19020 [Planctomycetota bacterium]|jgi:hypothetical protein
MKTGFSTGHMFNADESFLQWTADQLSDIDYTRFEVCHEPILTIPASKSAMKE